MNGAASTRARRAAALLSLALALALACSGCAGSDAAGKVEANPASGKNAGVAASGGPAVWGTPAALDSLRSGGVAVLGAVQVNEVDQARPPLIAALDSVLGARWPAVPMFHYARVRSALDDSTARFLLLGYQLHGRPEPLWLGRASDSLRDFVRYGVLARVHRQRTRTEERDTDRTDASGRSVKERATILESDVSVHLYDLRTRGLLFSGEYQGVAESAGRSDSLPRPERPPLSTWSTPEDRAREPMTAPIGGFMRPPPLHLSVAHAIGAFTDSLAGAGRTRGVPAGKR
jgi:hypothetical protein